MGAISLVPVPDISSEDISSLTEKRQSIIISLWHGDKTLSRIAESKWVDSSISTVSKSIEKLKSSDMVERDDNKVYSLTHKGEGIALMIAEPNGTTEEEYREKLQKWIEETLIEQGKTLKTAKEEAEKAAKILRDLDNDASERTESQQNVLEVA